MRILPTMCKTKSIIGCLLLYFSFMTNSCLTNVGMRQNMTLLCYSVCITNAIKHRNVSATISYETKSTSWRDINNVKSISLFVWIQSSCNILMLLHFLYCSVLRLLLYRLFFRENWKILIHWF